MDDTNKLINLHGGTQAVATLCELDISTVSQWRRRGIPPGWRKYLETLPAPKKTNGKIVHRIK